MNRKKDLVQLSEAYENMIVNELGGFTPGDGRSTVPTPNNPTTVSVSEKPEDCEDIHTDESESESSMAKAELFKIHKAAKELYDLISKSSDIEPWVFSKITVAASYLDGVRHYLDYENFKKDGEFNVDSGGHEGNIVAKVRQMLHGESKEVVESVIRQAIFSLEALTPLQEDKS